METRANLPQQVEAFVERVRSLDDDDRQALAHARASIDEAFHAGAWRAAVECAAERAEHYFEAWARIGAAIVPERLRALLDRGAEAAPDDVARWQDVARLSRLAVDDALLAKLALDRMRPPDLRELHAPWQAMLEAAHARDGAA